MKNTKPTRQERMVNKQNCPSLITRIQTERSKKFESEIEQSFYRKKILSENGTYFEPQ